MEINPSKGDDKSDRFRFEPNMSPNKGGLLSVLSVPAIGLFEKPSFYSLDGISLHDEHQERLAIAEYDGHQTPTQAERIAYLDAFAAVLVKPPHDDSAGDCLSHRIKAAKEWLLDQGMVQLK